jgi:membrane protein DedA with SNARE-associated domain
MFEAVLDWGVGLMAEYGLWAIFILMFLETALILHGVPTEFIMTFGALPLMRTPADLFIVILVGTAGATLGSQAVYWAAYYGGRPFVLRYPRVFRMTEERLDRFDRLFESPSGAVLVFACRLVPFLRGVVSIPAGLARMNGWLYFALSTIGAALFNTLLAGTTYLTHRVPTSPPARFFAAASGHIADNAAWVSSILVLAIAVGAVAIWKRHVVAPHYRRHVPPGASGFIVLCLVVGLILSAILVAAPAVYRGLVTSGAPFAVPLLVFLGAIAVATFLAAWRHHAASLLGRIGGPSKRR